MKSPLRGLGGAKLTHQAGEIAVRLQAVILRRRELATDKKVTVEQSASQNLVNHAPRIECKFSVLEEMLIGKSFDRRPIKRKQRHSSIRGAECFQSGRFVFCSALVQPRRQPAGQ